MRSTKRLLALTSILVGAVCARLASQVQTDTPAPVPGAKPVTTEHVAEGIAFDYDAERKLAGIEILDATQRLGDPAALTQVVLENVALRPT